MLWIDGTTDDGLLSGRATKGPWAIFDDKRQDWIATGIRYRWIAAIICWWHNLQFNRGKLK